MRLPARSTAACEAGKSCEYRMISGPPGVGWPESAKDRTSFLLFMAGGIGELELARARASAPR